MNRRVISAAGLLTLSRLALLPAAASADLHWTSGPNPEAIGGTKPDGGGTDPAFIDLGEEEVAPSSGPIGRAKLDRSAVDPSFISLPARDEVIDLPGADRLPPGRYVLRLEGQRRGSCLRRAVVGVRMAPEASEGAADP
jgi:hypothetical protein